MTILFESAIRVTLIAAIVELVLVAMRIKAASVLHAVWASVVVLMLLLPAWVAWGPRASLPVLPPERVLTLPDLVPPPSPAGLAETAKRTGPVPSPARQGGGYTLLTVYLLGAGVLLLRLAIGTIRANRLTSASCVVPVTVGLLHPRIILPKSSQGWSRAQLDAVLAHEGEHIRRRDPLFQWIALLNRAIFWFHPLAWWLERRLSGLAEESCDAAVLAQGHDPREYSEYLLDLARSVERAGSRIEAVGMAMPGIGLKHRIRRMLSGVPIPRISRPRMACTLAVCAAAAAILAAGTLVRAQSPAPKFEVASVKSCKDGSNRGGGDSSPGRLSTGCDLLVDENNVGLIQRAYVRFAGGHPNPMGVLAIKGGPAWIRSEMYRIDARAEGRPSMEMMQGPMLQAVLEDRFRLRIHRETREGPAYALTLAKGRSKLKPFQEGKCSPVPSVRPFPPLPTGQAYCKVMVSSRGPSVDAEGSTLSEFSKLLNLVLDRPVIDKTGIAGRFDIHLEFSSDQVTPGLLGLAPEASATASDPTGPTIFTAIQEQLGLKLVSAKGPVEFLVIDHAEKPSEN